MQGMLAEERDAANANADAGLISPHLLHR